MTDERMDFCGRNFSIKELIPVYDPSCKMINSSSTESTNRAAFILVLPKSKQRVVEVNLAYLARKCREMSDE
jgi:hypothetical protein